MGSPNNPPISCILLTQQSTNVSCYYVYTLHSPGDAVVKTFDIEDDDLVVLGTDGLFDNMYPADIFAAVSPTSPTDVSSLHDAC